MRPENTYYHGSPVEFEAFDFSLLGSQSGAANSKLGYFLAIYPDVAANFGDFVYEVEVRTLRKQEISITELRRLHFLAEAGQHDFEAQRLAYIAAGCDVLRLIEDDGFVHMVIAMNPDVMHIVKRTAGSGDD